MASGTYKTVLYLIPGGEEGGGGAEGRGGDDTDTWESWPVMMKGPKLAAHTDRTAKPRAANLCRAWGPLQQYCGSEEQQQLSASVCA